MKTSIYTLAILALSAFTSCSKDYTCTCDKVIKTENADGSTTTTETQDSQYAFRDSEARAATKCNDLERTGQEADGREYTIECQL